MALDITKINGLIKVVAEDATAYINSGQLRIEVKGDVVQIHSELQEQTLEGSAPFTGDGESLNLEDFINYVLLIID